MMKPYITGVPARNSSEVKTQDFPGCISVYPFGENTRMSIDVVKKLAWDGEARVLIPRLPRATMNTAEARAIGLALLEASHQCETLNEQTRYAIERDKKGKS